MNITHHNPHKNTDMAGEELKCFFACFFQSSGRNTKKSYSWILIKIYLTSLTKACPHNKQSPVLFWECDSVTLCFTVEPSLFFFYHHAYSHTHTHAHTSTNYTHIYRTVFSDNITDGYSWCGWRVEWGKQWTRPGLKLELCCHMKMISLLN